MLRAIPLRTPAMAMPLPLTLLTAGSHGIHYLPRDIQALDKTSRKILDRFL
jgi:hypothetical protein